jgi:hypothetical protein
MSQPALDTKPAVVGLYGAYEAASKAPLSRAYGASCSEFAKLSEDCSGAYAAFKTERSRLYDGVRCGDEEAQAAIDALHESYGAHAFEV